MTAGPATTAPFRKMIWSATAGTIKATPIATPANPHLSGQPQCAVLDIYLARTSCDMPIATARRRESPKTRIPSPQKNSIPPMVRTTAPTPTDCSSKIQPSATSKIPKATAAGARLAGDLDSRRDASSLARVVLSGCMSTLRWRSPPGRRHSLMKIQDYAVGFNSAGMWSVVSFISQP